MNWSDYETLVKSIYEALGAQRGVRVVCYGKDCKVRGKSDVDHQVDVLLEHSDGIHTYQTAIECKYWNKRRPKDDVTKLAEIIEDAHIDKGIIVSKLGFTEDAEKVARYKNIELVELRTPTDDDWKGLLRDVEIELVICSPVASEFAISLVKDGPNSGATPGEIVDIMNLTLQQPDQQIATLQEIIQEMMASATEDGELVKRVFKSGTVAKDVLSGQEMDIASIRFIVKFTTTKRKLQIRGEDHVAMIMKVVFSGKRFSISPAGTIQKVDT